MKKLIIYYSYTGNTKNIIEKIADKIDCDILRIEPITPYSNNYQEVVDEALEQTKANYQPEIKTFDIDLNKYSEIILGTPVWCYTFASPINTFLNKYDLSDKIIIPVVTNGGWIGHTIEDIKNVTKALIKDELNLKFDGNILKNEEEFNKWVERIDK